MNDPSCRRQHHSISCFGPTWINSARMAVITNPSVYCSLRQGRRREISNVSTQSSVWHERREDGGRSQKPHLNIDLGKPQPERLSPPRLHEPVKADGCTSSTSTAPALAVLAAGVILVQPLHLNLGLKLSSSWGIWAWTFLFYLPPLLCSFCFERALIASYCCMWVVDKFHAANASRRVNAANVSEHLTYVPFFVHLTPAIAAFMFTLPGIKDEPDTGGGDWIKTVSGQGKKNQQHLTQQCGRRLEQLTSDVIRHLLRLSLNDCWTNGVSLERELWCDGSWLKDGGSNSGGWNGDIEWMRVRVDWNTFSEEERISEKRMNEQRRSQSGAAQNLNMSIKHWHWKHPAFQNSLKYG